MGPPSHKLPIPFPYFGLSPFPVIVTTRIVSCLVGNPYKFSFATITGKGDNPTHTSRDSELGVVWKR